jgi:dTDP-4-amino-4,6-dideoxygalactose transaminase
VASIGPRELVSGIGAILGGQRALARFELELKAYFGVKHCFLVSSGKAALTLTLRALKELHPGRDEVLIPAFTCFSVPASVGRAGLRIKLCDLDPGSLDFDFAQLTDILAGRHSARPGNAGSPDPGDTSGVSPGVVEESPPDPQNRILAVVPTHLFGLPVDVPGLRALVRDPGITIVEDAAQAMGEFTGTDKAGTQGDVGFFSLDRGKALSAVEGGVVVTNRDDIAAAISRNFQHLPRYNAAQVFALVLKAAALMLLTHPRLYWMPQSLPFLKLGLTLYEPDFPMMKMSPFQAGLTATWSKRLGKMRESRQRNVARWIAVSREPGNGSPPIRILPSMALLRFPLAVSNSGKRESLLKESRRRGLGIAPVYPDAINRIPELALSGRFPVAERLAGHLVTLPTHHYVTRKDVNAIGSLLACPYPD